MKKAPDFQDFWDAYGVKRERIDAERAWNRLSARDKRAAIAGIAAYREGCRRTGVAMKYGQGYLSHRRWEDEAPGSAADRRPALPAPGAYDDMDIW